MEKSTKGIYEQKKKAWEEFLGDKPALLEELATKLNTKILTQEQYEMEVFELDKKELDLAYFVWRYELTQILRKFQMKRKKAMEYTPGEATIRTINETPVDTDYKKMPYSKMAKVITEIAADVYNELVQHCKNIPALPFGRKGFPSDELDQLI